MVKLRLKKKKVTYQHQNARLVQSWGEEILIQIPTCLLYQFEGVTFLAYD